MRNIVAAASPVVALLVLAACRASIRTGENVPIVGDSVIEVEIDPYGSSGSIPPQPGLPAGSCVKIKCFDAQGREIGEVEVTVGDPNPAPFPEGTEGGLAEPCDPPEDVRHKIRGRRMELVADPLLRFPFKVFPIRVADGHGVFANFYVDAAGQGHAELVAGEFMAHLFDAPAPAGLEMHSAAEIALLEDGRGLVTLFSAAQPTALDFEWNGSWSADLDGAVVEFRDGWYRTIVVVPAGEVEASATQRSVNGFEYVLDVTGGRIADSFALTVDP